MTATKAAAPPNTSLLAREPALALSYTTGLIVWLLAFLVAHGIITGTQASVLTQAVAPVVAGLIVAASGHLIRRYVSPATQASIVRDVQRVEHELTPGQLLAIRGMVLSAVEPLVLRIEGALGVKKPAKPAVKAIPAKKAAAKKTGK